MGRGTLAVIVIDLAMQNSTVVEDLVGVGLWPPTVKGTGSLPSKFDCGLLLSLCLHR